MVTKGEISDFFKFCLDPYDQQLWKIEKSPFRTALIELSEILSDYFLFGKPRSHVLEAWQYNYCLKMGEVRFKPADRDKEPSACNLEPYFLSYKRDKQIDSIIV